MTNKIKIGDIVTVKDFREYKTHTEGGIENLPCIHGTWCADNGKTEGRVVDIIDNNYYMINYINDIGEEMQLGYLLDNLILVKGGKGKKNKDIIFNGGF